MLGDPNYGCTLIERVFMYNGVVIPALIREDIINAVSMYEPRISISGNDITIIQEGNILRIYLQYTIKETGEINTYNLEITADDNPYR